LAAGAHRASEPNQTFRDRVGALGNLPPFLKQIWATSPPLTMANIGFRIVRALLPVATLYIGKLIIDEALRLTRLDLGAAGFGEWLASGELAPLIRLLLFELGLAVLSDVLGRVVALTDSLLSERFNNAASVQLMQHAATLDLEHFEDSEIQDKIDRARRLTMGRMALMSQLFGQAQSLLTILTFAGGLMAYAPWLILLLAIALIPAFLGEVYFNSLNYSLNFAWTPERREIEYVRLTAFGVETAKEIKIFGISGFLIERYRRLAEAFHRANRRLAISRAAWGSALTALGTLSYYAAYAYIAWRTVIGEFSIGDLTFLAGSFLRLRTLLEGLLTGLSEVAGQALYLDDLFSFYELKPRIRSPARPAPFPDPIRQGFRFENVGFRYPESDHWAVRNLSFTLKAGEVLALVGENGAGKTTLVKLLARLYDPDEGRILLDGVDLRGYDIGVLRSHFSVIFQDFVRYHLTAGENIAVGRIEARHDRERIMAAAKRSLADEVIARLPRGYDQLIGRRFRMGVELSGGEWQKVAIARAYMRDAQVLILDEPTAALDARAEFEVFQRFKELSAGKTVVLISHRFANVRMADRILVMNEGEIEAIGTHQELLRQQGRYAELFELQAAGYR
jgi:ATP-binding cassette subfamily B protein